VGRARTTAGKFGFSDAGWFRRLLPLRYDYGKHRNVLALLALGCFSNNGDDNENAIELLLGRIAVVTRPISLIIRSTSEIAC